MKTYTITTRSILYTTYEIEAETEAHARRSILDNPQNHDPLCEETEDTEVAWVDEEDTEEDSE